jgi:hypothetical protein
VVRCGAVHRRVVVRCGAVRRSKNHLLPSQVTYTRESSRLPAAAKRVEHCAAPRIQRALSVVSFCGEVARR